MICGYYIHKTDLADLSGFRIKMEIFVANIEISSYNLRKPNSLCFPCVLATKKIGPFSLFSLCRGYPVQMRRSVGDLLFILSLLHTGGHVCTNLESAMTAKSLEQEATIFSWVRHPPPPLIRFRFTSTSSAPSITRSNWGRQQREISDLLVQN